MSDQSFDLTGESLRGVMNSVMEQLRLRAEGAGFDSVLLDKLVTASGPASLEAVLNPSRYQAVGRNGKTGVLLGATESRKDGCASGF